ncbi:MAG TPA: hypothetical protein V6D37_10995 [Candidatus Sericytochromatia bacterium]
MTKIALVNCSKHSINPSRVLVFPGSVTVAMSGFTESICHHSRYLLFHHAHICDNRYALLECSDITKRWHLHYTESFGGIQASAVL